MTILLHISHRHYANKLDAKRRHSDERAAVFCHFVRTFRLGQRNGLILKLKLANAAVESGRIKRLE